MGHPSEIKLESRINELLVAPEGEVQKGQSSELTKEQVKKFKSAVGKDLK